MTYQASTFNNATILAHAQNDVFTLDDFIAEGENGTGSSIQANGSFDISQQPSFNLKFTTQNLPITAPVAMFDGIGLNGGRLTSTWELTSSGETALQMVRTLSGTGSIHLSNTTFIGADLPTFSKIIQQAQEQDESKQVFEPKLKHALTNGTTPVQQLSGSFSIKDGLWQLHGTQLSATEASSDDTTIQWDIPTSVVKTTIPLKLTQYTALPSITLALKRDKRGVTYTQDIDAFA